MIMTKYLDNETCLECKHDHKSIIVHGKCQPHHTASLMPHFDIVHAGVTAYWDPILRKRP